MDSHLRSQISTFSRGFNSSSSNYLLRSASKNNNTKKSSVYSKFLGKPGSALGEVTPKTPKEVVKSYLDTTKTSGFYHLSGVPLRWNETGISTHDLTKNRTRNETGISTHDLTKNRTRSTNGFPLLEDSARLELSHTIGQRRVLNGVRQQEWQEEISQIESSQLASGRIHVLNGVREQERQEEISQIESSQLASGRIQDLRAIAADQPSQSRRPSSPCESTQSLLQRCDTSSRFYKRPVVLLKDFRKFGKGSEDGKRDNDGFLIPFLPVRYNLNEKAFSDIKREAIIMLNDLLDTLDPVDAFSFLSTTQDIFSGECRKGLMKNINDDVNDSRMDRTTEINWPHLGLKSGGIPLNAETSSLPYEYAPSVRTVSSAPSVASSCRPPSASCILQEWTLVKGKASKDVMLSGSAYDINTKELIEEGHWSSKVIVADKKIVQTNFNTYLLSGEIHDPEKRIPEWIRRCFIVGFPKDWKKIIEEWSLSIGKENLVQTSFFRRAPYNGYGSILEESRIKQSLIERYVNNGREPNERKESSRRDDDERRMQYKREHLPSNSVYHSGLRDIDEEEEENFFERNDDVEERPVRERVGENRRREDKRIRPVGRAECNNRRERGQLVEREAAGRGKSGRREEVVREARRLQEDDSADNNLSRYGRKRKINCRYEDFGARQKKMRQDESNRIVMRTPTAKSGRLSFISQRTRSSRRLHEINSFLGTPKSSKQNKFKNRQKTPGPPPKGRRIFEENNSSPDNSDLQ